MTENKLKEAYALFEENIKRREGEKEKLEQIITAKEKEIDEIKEKIYLYQQVNEIYKKAAEYAREKSKVAIENIVSRALSIVFSDDLKFEVEIKRERDKDSARFLVSSTYGGEFKITNEPQEARGGGVVDIISLALRIALLETSKFNNFGPLVLDEPAKHVSGEHIDNVAAFLRTVITTFNRQIIMVTHNQYLAESGDIVYEVKIEDGESQVKLKSSSELPAVL
ncbi:ATPase [Thermosyntropha sp.]|uniref:ATPase n=1 Tax=Thermosyntropha sp. TaxID=2740820 RepID=UPI0025DA0876|nr:ATPase [Thermosyntropha sp.]MBO8158360.1 hypothetical protein [Thermosyntropha sp.]